MLQLARDIIPPITDPHGRYWDQPSTDRIWLDDETAYMTADTWGKLAEYSCSHPSGVYDGKMWKRADGAFAPPGTPITPMLMWYGPSGMPDSCSVESRVVRIVKWLPSATLAGIVTKRYLDALV